MSDFNIKELARSLIGAKVRAHIGVHEYNGRKYNHIDYYLEPLPRPLAALLLANWADWLDENPCPVDDGRNEWIFDCACACRFHALPPTMAVKLIHALRRTNPPLLTRDPRTGEVEHAVESAYDYQAEPGEERTKVKAEPFNPELLAEHANQLPEMIRDDLVNWLAFVSPASINISPAEYLNIAFPGEKVLVSTNMHEKGGFVYEGPYEAAEMERFAQGNRPYVRNGKTFCGGWYLANPVDGEWRGEGDDSSCRSGDNLTSFRYIVLESDAAPPEQWLAMLVQEPLAIVALYTSGNRSIHALVRIPANNKKQFDRIRSEYLKKYRPLGADRGAMSAVRLTRLPGVVRNDNGNTQRLLYLNPRPLARPIYQKKNPL